MAAALELGDLSGDESEFRPRRHSLGRIHPTRRSYGTGGDFAGRTARISEVRRGAGSLASSTALHGVGGATGCEGRTNCELGAEFGEMLRCSGDAPLL